MPYNKSGKQKQLSKSGCGHLSTLIEKVLAFRRVENVGQRSAETYVTEKKRLESTSDSSHDSSESENIGEWLVLVKIPRFSTLHIISYLTYFIQRCVSCINIYGVWASFNIVIAVSLDIGRCVKTYFCGPCWSLALVTGESPKMLIRTDSSHLGFCTRLESWSELPVG
jgi:hypothetical protein